MYLKLERRFQLSWSRFLFCKQPLNILFLVIGLYHSNSFSIVPETAQPQTKAIAIINATAHIGNGKLIEKSLITFDKGIITGVYDFNEKQIELTNHEIIDASGKDIYPGFILPVSDVGLWEVASVKATIDHTELGEFNPNIRSLTSYNTDSEYIPTLRFNGVLTVQTAPSGGVISGTSSIVKLDGWNWEDAAYKTDDAIHLHWPKKESLAFDKKTFSFKSKENPHYFETITKLTQLFQDAKHYKDSQSTPVNLKLSALQGLFNQSKQLYLHTDSEEEIIASINFAEKFAIKKLVIVGGEETLLMKELISSKNIPVIIKGTFNLPNSSDKPVDLPFKLPALLHKAGIKVGLTIPNSADMVGRNLAFAAGMAAAYGLNKEQALSMISQNNAEILGVSNTLGSIEIGKDATLFISQGDALDIKTNKIQKAFIKGAEIDLMGRQQQLYQRYKKRYEQLKP